jgi:hypothetical protein
LLNDDIDVQDMPPLNIALHNERKQLKSATPMQMNRKKKAGYQKTKNFKLTYGYYKRVFG